MLSSLCFVVVDFVAHGSSYLSSLSSYVIVAIVVVVVLVVVVHQATCKLKSRKKQAHVDHVGEV